MTRKLLLIATLITFCQLSLADPAFDSALAKAKKGDAVAQLTVATAYLHGQGVIKNDGKAHSWFLKSAEKGNAEAQYSMGTLYASGQGVKQDFSTAAKWYEKAAAKKHANAEYQLGVLYEEGKGVKQNYKKAATFYNNAAAHGQIEAKTAGEKLNEKIAAESAEKRTTPSKKK
jgi:TPR repeat protein